MLRVDGLGNRGKYLIDLLLLHGILALDEALLKPVGMLDAWYWVRDLYTV